MWRRHRKQLLGDCFRRENRPGGILHVSQGENRVFITGNAALFMEGEIQASF